MNWLKNNKKIIIIPLIYLVIHCLNQAKIMNNYILQVLMLIGINLIMTESLNVLTGMTGQTSLGQAGFMAVGAYISAIVTSVLIPAKNFSSAALVSIKIGKVGFQIASIPQTLIFLLGTLAGGIVAAIFGYLIGTPSLKLKGDYLAIVTLGFGEVIRQIIRVTPIVGKSFGMTGIPKLANFFWIYFFAILTIFICRNFMDSSYGRACMAVRDNEIAADTIGINTARYKVIAFVFSAFIAGISGSMFAHTMVYLHPDTFAYTKSTDYVIYLYAGGVGSISGAVLGAAALTALPEILRQISNWRLVIYGLLLVLIILFRPTGLFGGREFSFLGLKTGGIKTFHISDLWSWIGKKNSAKEAAK